MTQLALSFTTRKPQQPASAAAMPRSEDDIVALGLSILEGRIKTGACMKSPKTVRDWVALKLSGLEHEAFFCLYLNCQLEYLDSHQIFRGTLSQAAVYTREIAKEALNRNAAALIVAHNHPSGRLEPSRADIETTLKLEQAMQLLDIQLVDHVIVAGGKSLSLKEGGYF